MLSQNKFINDSTTLESAGKKFQLGFFRPGNSKHRYLGIWYSNIPIQTVVWVANRNHPLNDSSGVLKIGDDGNLILLDETKRVVWNTSIQKVSSETTVAKLLDSGNLVLSSGSTESYLWQSFDHPSDTLLAGMKLGWDLRIGLNRYLTSWRNPDDPSTGEFSYGIELFGLPQNVLRKNSVKAFRSSHWLGVQYSGAGVYPNHVFNSNFVLNSQEVYYEYGLYDQLTRSVLNYSGTLQRLVWKSSSQEWFVMYSFPTDPCDSYGQCGPNAVCTINNLKICSCLAGYVPKSSQDWEMHIWSGGCVRKNPLNCSEGEGFIELKGVEIPDLLRFWMNTSMTPNECEVQCLKNCSCTAYTHSVITEGNRSCFLWYGDLIDMKRHMIYGTQNLYIRVSASELEVRSDSQKKVQLMAVMIPVSVALLFLLLASCITWKRRTQKQDDMLSQNKFINDSTTLESAGKKFQLGFFTPGNSNHRYLGIWYSNIPTQTVVWVANRNNPLNDSSGVLKIGDNGNLILLDETKRVVWNTSIHKVSSETTVKLLDSGNLVLSSGNTESYLWQSFDHPSDTLLAGMKLGWDLRIGLNRYLTSWRNPDDPSTGEFSYGIELFGLPQNVLRKNSVKSFRSSHWLGVQYSSAGVYSNHVFNSNFVLNSQEVYYEYGLYDQLTRSVLNYSGTLQRLVWKSSSQEWLVMYSFPTDPCDSYGQCGPNAVCTINNLQICSCLAGYVPKSSQDWETHIWSSGCVRKNPFNCSEGEGFIELKGVEIPDLLRLWMNTSMTPNECEVQCLKNCSCTAYTHSAITEGSRSCLLWYGDLIDMKRHMIYGDQNLYIRVTASELENRSDSQKKVQLMAVMIPVSVALLFLLLASCITWKRRTQKQDDMLSQNKFINDSTTLESAGKKFQLGFFRPGNSKHRYLGIWYSNIPIQTVVWVANRNNPLNDSSGVLKIGDDGNLILLDETKRVVWNTSIQKVSSETTVVKLLDSGNLVLSSGNTESYLWQSFDHPSDTLLAGMKLGWDLRIGLNRYLTAWRNPDDPSTGEFSYGIELFGLPQNVLRKNSVKAFRSSHWLGVQYSSDGVYSNQVFNSNFVLNSQEVYYEYGLYDQLTRSVLNYSGTLQRLVWKSSSQEWLVMYSFPTDPCDSYGQCGPNAVCTINNLQICSCLAGYVPKSSQDWEMHIWSGGCVPKNPFNCSEGEGFIELKGVEIPDLLSFWMNTSMTPNECEVQCLKNCSCTAYTHSVITEGSRSCLLWYGDLIDMKRHMIYGDQNLYIRVTASELENRSDSQKKVQLMAAMIPVSVALLFLLLASCITWKKRTQKQGSKPGFSFKVDENIELPIFSVVTIAEATNNFSFSNKIGEGGFGSVYKGQLSTGQEIAVKRLSEDSHQGLHEFKNEVILISKLQHRNLVRLLGCCVQGGERMLIYEYMSNGSLSSFIFDNRSNSLTWSKRFNIIVGIARGLLYLHRDSRLRIIHRDLKASNVLLDGEMNPKISDFGIARAFGRDQLLDKTRTVMGTYGYMSPEYVIHGLFSMKSDVYSFGVLVLEIVSGKRNGELCDSEQSLRLLGHTWKLWNEGKALELLDAPMEDSFTSLEVLKCIQIGLLCVQKRPEDRPTMASVLSALDSEITTLPQPKQPGFYAERSTDVTLDGTLGATNNMTITVVVGR
ncbi:uncharacterized protein LOC130760506 isoform X2 [Actinidia eriantha]|nr:uncharacterized protein LOC130760506 isoform X2 [Actinidia eriantha]